MTLDQEPRHCEAASFGGQKHRPLVKTVSFEFLLDFVITRISSVMSFATVCYTYHNQCKVKASSIFNGAHDVITH
jgi:hypothetical protein